jgi:hypothetical protein
MALSLGSPGSSVPTFVGPLIAAIGSTAVIIGCLIPWITAPGFLSLSGTDVAAGRQTLIAGTASAALAGIMFWPPARKACAVLLAIGPPTGIALTLAVVLNRFRELSGAFSPGAGMYLVGIGLALIVVGASFAWATGPARAAAGAAMLVLCAASAVLGIQADKQTFNLQRPTPAAASAPPPACTPDAINVPNQVAASATTLGVGCAGSWALAYFFAAGTQRIGFFQASSGRWRLADTTTDLSVAQVIAGRLGMPLSVLSTLESEAHVPAAGSTTGP